MQKVTILFFLSLLLVSPHFIGDGSSEEEEGGEEEEVARKR
jgi:hypothetical protein